MKKRAWWTTLDLATIALIARLALVVVALCEPVWDGHYYAIGARRIAAGLGYSEDLIVAGDHGVEHTIWFPWAHYPVGYSALIGLFLRLFGDRLAVAPTVNAVTGALLAAVCHRVARAMFVHEGVVDDSIGERRAWVAGLIVALHPGLVLYSGAWMTEPLAALLMLGSLAIANRDRRARAAAVAGIALGLATLVRPNAILLAPFVGILGIERARSNLRSFSRWSVRAGLVSVVALATVAPWTIRNCRVMDACALVSTNGGWNLVIGSAPGATGKFEFLVGHIPEGAPTCDDGGQVAQDRCWFRYGVQTIAHAPLRWVALMPAKLHYTLDAEWFPINYLREGRPDLVSKDEHIAWGRVLTTLQHALLLLSALAALGVVRLHRARAVEAVVQITFCAAIAGLFAFCIDRSEPIAWPLALVAVVVPMLRLPGRPRLTAMHVAVIGAIATTLFTHAIFFGEDRYHLVITPAFALLACGLGRRSEA